MLKAFVNRVCIKTWYIIGKEMVVDIDVCEWQMVVVMIHTMGRRMYLGWNAIIAIPSFSFW